MMSDIVCLPLLQYSSRCKALAKTECNLDHLCLRVHVRHQSFLRHMKLLLMLKQSDSMTQIVL